MMSKKNKIIFLTVFSVITCFLTYHLCYFIAEKYFFDKFFYEKSIAHGYKSPNKQFDYADYGDRAKDLDALENFHQENILQSADRKYFRIAIIGDSHVWGQGIRNNQRFANLLENKLNRIRPTKIYSYGKPGNGTLDYYNTYIQVSSLIPIDLYIIVPVTNDSILNQENVNDPITNSCQKNFPSKKPIFVPEDHSQNNDTIKLSWENPVNQCIVNSSLKLLPNSNAIYLIDKNYHRDNTQFNYYLQAINNENKYILSTEVGKFMDKYKKYFDQNVYQNFDVSKLDPHPNAIANQMYADIIYDEITSNPRWNFLSNEK